MSIRETIVNSLRALAWNALGAPMLPSGVSARLNIPDMSRPAETVLMCQAALKARVGAIQQARLLVADGSGNVLESGELVRLLQRPNQLQDAAEFIGSIEGHLTLRDMATIAIVRPGPDRNPTELVPLNPARVTAIRAIHQPTGTEMAVGWQYVDGGTGRSVVFDRADMIVITGFNPDSPLRGLSSVLAGYRSMQTDLASREANLALFANGGMPDVALATDKPLTKEQADELMERWNSRYSGYANHHKTAILYNGLKAEKLGFAPQEMQFLEGLRMSAQEIMTAFRVMPAMVMSMFGESGLSQGSSIPEQKLAWWEDVGLSELDRIARAIQDAVVSRGNWITGRMSRAMTRGEAISLARAQKRGVGTGSGLRVYFDENQIPALVKHRLAKVEQAAKLLAMGYRPDDVNDYLDLGLPPHTTNIAVLSIALQPATDLAIPATDMAGGASAPRTARQAEAALDRAVALLDRAAAGEVERRSKKNQAHRRNFDALEKKHTRIVARKLSGYFVEQRDRVLAAVKEARSIRAERATVDLNDIFSFDAENQALARKLLGPWTQALEDGWQLAASQAGVENPFEIEDPNVQRAIEARRIQGSKLNETTAEDLRKIVAEATDEGLTTTELGDRIADYYAKQIGENSARPQTAARTQMAGIINDGQLASAKDMGGLKKIWIHGSPNEARAAHVQAESDYADGIGLDETFSVNGSSLDAPGDANAPIEETANCTCMVGFKPA